jgi:glycerate 2-kinase
MRIVIAPDSFKGTYTAEQVATAIATGAKDADGEPTEFVLGHNGFDTAIRTASAVVVGEGRLDRQTESGKLISAIVDRVDRALPIFAVVGSRGPDLGDYARNFAAIHVASRPADMRRAGAGLVVALRATATTA